MGTKTPQINPLTLVVRFVRVSRLLILTIWVISHERRRVVRGHVHDNQAIQINSVELIKVLGTFRETAGELGVLMIKLGQFLSARVDLLPEKAIALLSSLQDEVPPAPFDHVVKVIESELGKPVGKVFSVLEPHCIAAASLGQVHKAILASTGETVAVKIQRPHCDQLVRMDLGALKFVIWVITRFVDIHDCIDLMGVYHEFERMINEEIDYLHEAENAKRFKELFKSDPTICIPRVYDEYVTRRLLVLEWVDGIKINDYPALEAAGINRFEVARCTMCAYFYQFFQAGFFHADPHPGNIFIKQGSTGNKPIVTFVDFGMVEALSSSTRRFLKDAFLALLARDARSLVNALSQLGFIDEAASHGPIERAMALMMERYHGLTLDEVSKLDIPQMAQELASLLYRQPIHIPARFVFIGRALGTLVGVATGLAPEFNFIEVATPYARKFLGFDSAGAQQTLQQLFNHVLDASRVLLTLPRSLEQAITRLEAGQIEVKLSSNRSNKWIRVRGLSGGADTGASPGLNSFICLLMFVAALVGGIFLLASVHQFIAGWFCFGLAGLALLRV